MKVAVKMYRTLKLDLETIRAVVKLPLKTPWKEISNIQEVSAELATTAIKEQYGPLLPGIKFFAPSEDTMTESPGNEKIGNYDVDVGVEVLSANINVGQAGSASTVASLEPLGQKEINRLEGMLLGELSRLGIVPTDLRSSAFEWKWHVDIKGN